jgi:hypothetical protein
MPLYRPERDALEATFLREAETMLDRYGGAQAEVRARSLAAFTATCFEKAAQSTERWTTTVSSTPVRRRPPIWFSLAWKAFDRQADFSSGS